jgi:hypothetical protein
VPAYPYNGDPAPAQLAKYFFLDDNDRAEIASHRGTHNRLGYAIQLCTVRFLGTFLPEPTDVPSIVVKHLAEQWEIPDANCLGQYRERLATHHTHAREIRERHSYRDFAEEPEHWRLVRWLYTRAWLSAERPTPEGSGPLCGCGQSASDCSDAPRSAFGHAAGFRGRI